MKNLQFIQGIPWHGWVASVIQNYAVQSFQMSAWCDIEYSQGEINTDSSFLTEICVFITWYSLVEWFIQIVPETVSNLGSFPLSYMTTYIKKEQFHILLTLILTLIEDKSLPKITMLSNLNYEQWEFSLLGLTVQSSLRCYPEWRFCWKKKDLDQKKKKKIQATYFSKTRKQKCS